MFTRHQRTRNADGSRLCGSVVVWSDAANNSDVYAKDLAGGSQIAVATSSAVEAYPACDAGRVVYMYAPVGGDADIRLYDIGSGQTTVVSNELWNEWRRRSPGIRVVWQAWPTQPNTTEGIQIFGTNLDTGQDFVVTNRPRPIRWRRQSRGRWWPGRISEAATARSGGETSRPR